MTQQLNRPLGFGKLTLSHCPNWQDEIALHENKTYFGLRAKAINAIHAQGKLACCHFCGFPDHKFLELHHLDGNHANNQPQNLVLACSLCHRYHHLGWIGLKRLGVLQYLPLPLTNPASGIHEMHNIVQRYNLLSDYRKGDEPALSKALSKTPKKQPNTPAQNPRHHTDLKQEQTEYESSFFTQAFHESLALLGARLTGQSTEQNGINKIQDIVQSFGILDLLNSLDELDKQYIQGKQDTTKASKSDENTPSMKFFDAQKTGQQGFFVVHYDKSIFEPWSEHLGYNYDERIRWYVNKGLADRQGISSLLQQQKFAQSKLYYS